jgi:hypothetical protein
MADSAAFELVCEVLERDTSLDRLEARGTVRLALKAAGLDARNVASHQMAVVVANLLPSDLQLRGVKDSDGICASLREKLARLETQESAETPEAVFARLGG